MNAVVTLESIVGSVCETFERVCVDTSISFKREQEFALQVLYSNDYARKIALANPQSVRDAVTNIAAIGISLNPAKKQAYLVPRKGGICLDISYIGLAELAMASGSVRWVKSELVRANDTLILNGIDKAPTHQFDPFSRDRGEVVGVYCVVKTSDGDFLTDTMSISEVHDIRDRSEAWKAFITKQKSCPWSTDPGEMTKKTIVKRASKLWPKTERLDQAIHHLNTDGGEGFTPIQNSHSGAEQVIAKPAFSAADAVAQIEAAQDDKAIVKIRREGLSAASAARDRGAYDRIIAAVLRRRIELGFIIDTEGVTQ